MTREECTQESDGDWGGDKSFEVLRCRGYHLVVIHVIPVGGGVCEKKLNYFHKNYFGIASDCVDFDYLRGKPSGGWGGGHAPRSP